jgi:DNA-3-methyladenine glycosylase
VKKLPRTFYTRPTLNVARDLLGKILVRKSGRAVLSGKIVEVEAYLGAKDPASHAYKGRTRRNEVMFRQGGHLYVYFTYGMHFCANVVTEQEGVAGAVLLRALEPIKGIKTMGKNRGLIADQKDERILTNGPAKLCEALGIRREQNGCDLLDGEIFLLDDKRISTSRIGTSVRIGIRVGTTKRWRFYIKGNNWVSRPGLQRIKH